jgi:N-hydroxyarylamine O-acetyltransferase
MVEPPIDFAAYGHRIGCEVPTAPTLAALARLIERHAAAIPFENIDVLAGRVPRLDTASLEQKLVQRRRGGYCFEQNRFFGAVLRQAGFVVAGLEARVRAGVPADVITGRTHMALRVTLDGADYLADVGFGVLAPTGPLRLCDRQAQRDPVGAYRFLASDGDLLLQCEGREGWMDCYRIAPSHPHEVDYELANWYVATHPGAMLRQNLLVGRSTKAGRLTLFNDTLTLRKRAPASPEESRLASRAEFTDVLRDAFGLPIDDSDLDAVMTVIERQAAAQDRGEP